MLDYTNGGALTPALKSTTPNIGSSHATAPVPAVVQAAVLACGAQVVQLHISQSQHLAHESARRLRDPAGPA